MPFILCKAAKSTVCGGPTRSPRILQLHAITFHPGKANFERVALGPNGLHLDSLARWLRRRYHGFCVEVERDAEHISILDIEQMVIVQVIRLPPQCAADDLLA